MLTVGLYPNLFKKNLIKVTESLISWFEDRGYLVLLPKDVAKSLCMPHLSTDVNDLVRKIDVAITLGGDGTLLSVARQTAPHKVPILGINMGHVGFLTEVELSDLYTDLEYFNRKDYSIDVRMMLEAEVVRGKRVLKTSWHLMM